MRDDSGWRMGELADNQILKFVGRNKTHFLIHHLRKLSSKLKIKFSDLHSIYFFQREAATDNIELIVWFLPDGIEGKVNFLKLIDSCKFPRICLNILDLVEGKSNHSKSRREIVDYLELIVICKDLFNIVVAGIVQE